MAVVTTPDARAATSAVALPAVLFATLRDQLFVLVPDLLNPLDRHVGRWGQ